MGLAGCAWSLVVVVPIVTRAAMAVWHPKEAKGIEGIGDLVT
jgi:hypothetical protein